ncbi:hypothetical protein [Thalassospira permensis]|uniref:Uncharacterized protein n=1 Tax=Thalassospira permensis NBRC 106175 TaxID=1353532 RepID=A0ABR4TS09_9PROT|nr:hypothetical protein [Thalassospira permensis]KEO58585.1 hypothetical protein SMB34_13805 [Thalassospira permensis NBRC 106175]
MDKNVSESRVEKKVKPTLSGFMSWRWLRDFCVVLVLLVVAWKIVSSQSSIDWSIIDFSGLVSILMSFFAVGLSVAFYFKATDTSNQFYDNVYKFTKDTSEILGRIEAGFGERLRHIDEGYIGLRDRVDRIPFNIGKAQEKLSGDEEEVEKIIKERNDIIEDLARRAQVDSIEKEKIISQMDEKDKEISMLRSEMSRLRRRIISASSDELPPGLEEYIMNLWEEKFGHVRPETSSILMKKLSIILDGRARAARKDLYRHGMIDSDGDLTSAGLGWLRGAISRFKSNQNEENFNDVI